MGIKGLNKFLRDMCPIVFKPTHISDFAHKKVAVDLSIYLYKYKAIFGDNWINPIINLVCSLRRNQVHPVFVFDTGSLPDKLKEKEHRSDAKKKIVQTVIELTDALHLYKRDGIISKTLLDYHNKINTKRFLSTKTINDKDIEESIRKLSLQNVHISRNDISLSKKLFDLLGVPYVMAPIEAETECSHLCKTGIVSAVLSDDTDLLAYNTPIMLSNYNSADGYCQSISPYDIQQELNFTYPQLLDFYIMCGTDYNTNIPNIGPKKAFQHVKTYGTIDVLPEKLKLDITNLLHTRVREIFLHYKTNTTVLIPFCTQPNYSLLKEFAIQNNVYLNISHLISCFECNIVLE